MNHFRQHRLLYFPLLILPYLFVFIASIAMPVDADLGWHLKYGEYFFDHGRVLRDNIFSTQMTGYKWANSSWATDLITYSVFSQFSFFGLTVLGAGIITVTFFFFAKAAKLTRWDQSLLFPLLLLLMLPFNGVSFRGQLLSMLFFGILFFLLQSYYDRKQYKVLLLLVPLFLVWSNLHGQFILGLALLFLWIGLYVVTKLIIRKKHQKLLANFSVKEVVLLTVICCSCVMAALANPFGFGVYKEALNHFGNPWQKYIVEWLPFEKFSIFWFSHILMGVAVLFGSTFLFLDKKVTRYMPIIGVCIVLFGLSLWMRRYTWPLYYLSLFLLKPIASFFEPKAQKVAYLITLLLVGISFAVAVKGKWPVQQYAKASWIDYCVHWQCSNKAAQFLIDNNLTTNLYTLYHWGGWLIWNYPQVKPSIDGRMHLWRDEKGYSAFAEYYPFEQNWQDIDTSKYNVVLMSWEKPVAERLLTLADQGKWLLAYEDEYAGVFVRNATPSATTD